MSAGEWAGKEHMLIMPETLGGEMQDLGPKYTGKVEEDMLPNSCLSKKDYQQRLDF